MAGLPGRVSLITGAAKGIGYACAQSLGEAGCKLLLADIDAEGVAAAADRLRQAGFEAEGIACDVGDRESVDAAVAKAVERFGRLDVTVANAGIVKAADFLEMSEADWDAVIRVNLKGVFLTCQSAARQMVNQGNGGAIVTMSSVNAKMAIPAVSCGICGKPRGLLHDPLPTHRPPKNESDAPGRRGSLSNECPSLPPLPPQIASYIASKGGVDNLTRCMSLALAPHGIRVDSGSPNSSVNAVGPGSIDTDVLAAVAGDKAAKAKLLSRTPMLRIGQPSEIGSIVRFLASDDASYVTGQTLYADGGRMALNYTVSVPEDKL